MSRKELAFFSAILLILGAGWGITSPLSKIAVSTGYQHFGLIFWQMVVGALCMAVIQALRGRARLPLRARALKVYVIIALIGSVIPNTASYQAIAHLPAGVMSVLLSTIPMLAFPIALALGVERFSALRLAGLGLGFAGVMLLVLPDASLPEAAMLAWIPVAMIPALFYAFEGNYVARWGTEGLDAIEVLYGASIVGALIALPLALGAGQFITPLKPWGAPDWALVASSAIHVMVYAGYVWLVGRAGPVFAVQVSYLVTGFGVIWAMLILSETYSPWFWAAMALILLGVCLVQPRRAETLEAGPAMGETGR
ncbi:DMT family transporter [Aestuariivita boseongensis]|uniref:DMT family transporter n=1 Tax=Aestuariivita boseongensis TaxID=1470562 RepID=UPI000681C432|nr:DMT family transporter [Aestuariivita boseongensis]